jgi:hypothetical protein
VTSAFLYFHGAYTVLEVKEKVPYHINKAYNTK